MEVKEIIRNRRIELGLTMKDIATSVGVSEGTVSRWESGDIENMKRSRIQALANVLQISPLVIMGMDYTPEKPTPVPSISPEDLELLELFHAAPPEKQAAIRALLK